MSIDDIRCLSGHSHGLMFRVETMRTENGRSAVREYVAPVVLTNTSEQDGMVRRNAALFQLGMSDMPTSYPRFAMMQMDQNESDNDNVTLRVVGSPLRPDIDEVPLLPECMLARTGLLPPSSPRSHDVLEITQAFLEECKNFYHRRVQASDRYSETQSFIHNGGVHPMIDESNLDPESCRASLCVQGGTMQEVRGLNAAPMRGITDEWCRQGGDPSFVPLLLNTAAVKCCNSVLEACTYVQRAIIAGEPSVSNSRYHKVTMQRAYSLLRDIIAGDLLSSKSTVYVDGFNAVVDADRKRGWCEHPLLGVQKLHSLVKGTHHVSDKYAVSHHDSEIPVVLLDPMAFFKFEGEIRHSNKITACIHLRSKVDANHIRCCPKSFGDSLHAYIDDSLFEDSGSVTPRTAICKSYHMSPIRSGVCVANTLSETMDIPRVPYAIPVHPNTPAFDNPIVCAMTDWVCAVNNGTLLVQVDPETECNPPQRLQDVVLCMTETFSVAYLETQAMFESRDLLTSRLRHIDTSFASVPLRPLSRNECIARIRVAAKAITDLARLVAAFQMHQSSRQPMQPCLDFNEHASLCSLKDSLDQSALLSCVDWLRIANEAANVEKPLSGSKIRPMFQRHQDLLGRITDAMVLVVYPRRACVMVRVAAFQSRDGRPRNSPQDDFVVLMFNRHSGTDPEYFSATDKFQALKRRSSIRHAMKEATGHEELQIHSVYAAPTYGKKRWGVGPRLCLHGRKLRTLAVEWSERADRPPALALVQVNTCCTDRTTDAGVDPEWGIRVLHLGQRF